MSRFFLPSSRIPSASHRFEQRMIAVSEKKGKNWSVQQRLPSLTKVSVTVSRATYQNHLDSIVQSARHASRIPSPALLTNEDRGAGFLVVRKRAGKLIPIGFPKRKFSKVESLLKFAREIKREKVRIHGGKTYDVEKELMAA